MVKFMALTLLLALFPIVMLSFVLGIFAHPLFFLMLLLAILCIPSLMLLRQTSR
jgi:hypothetical protein